MRIYTFFVVNITTTIFIASVYGFAYRFLRDKFYLGIAMGWLFNAAYLLTEIPGVVPGPNPHSLQAMSPEGATSLSLAAGMLPAVCFHISAKYLTKAHIGVAKFLRPAMLASAALALAAFHPGRAELSTIVGAGFASCLFLLPLALYSCYVLLFVAMLLQYGFPDEEFGYASRVLYGSWAAYGLLQLTYPLKALSGLAAFFWCLFALALSAKLLGAAGLLNVLRLYYQSAQDRAREVSVLADLGDVAAGLHHDIANPLSAIDSAIGELSKQRRDDAVVSHFLAAVKDPMLALDAALQVVNLARLDDAELKEAAPTSARDIVNRAVKSFRAQYQNAPIRIFIHSVPQYYVMAILKLLSLAFINIIKNAYEAGATTLLITIGNSNSRRGWVTFLFKNNGPQMTQEELESCRKPGWSSKKQTSGRSNVGMGLYMVSKSVAIHGGRLEIRNRGRKPGVEVEISLRGSRTAEIR
jgi:signal transduction histidine kinase